VLKRLNTPIKDLDNKDITDPANGKTANLKDSVTTALLFQDQNTGQLTGEEKLKRFALAKKVHDAPETVDLTAEDIVLIKDCVNKLYTTLIYARLVEALDPKEA